MVIAQGEIWWTELPQPAGSEPGYRRPVLVIQGGLFNESDIATIVCIALTSQLKWSKLPGNVDLPARTTGLPNHSVANISQIVTVDRKMLTELVGRVSERKLAQVLDGVCLVIGR